MPEEVKVLTDADEISAKPLTINQEYFWKRTKGWRWIDGTDRWWEVFVKPTGFNGVGGYWIYEFWRWNGSGDNVRTEIRTLSAKESEKLELEVANAVR